MEVPTQPIGEVFGEAPVITVIVDATGEVQYTNRAWRRFGMENDNPHPSSVGENYLEVCLVADGDARADEVYRRLRGVLSGECEYFRTTYPCHAPDVRRWFDLHVWGFAEGADRYALLVHTDVTQREELELETRAELDRLESLSRILAYDLRNPISTAAGYAHLLDEQVDSPYLTPLRAAIERIESVVSNALVVARETLVTNPENVDLRTIVHQTWGSLDTRGATLSVEDDGVVDADPALLGQLLTNCFRNAVEHGSTDGRPAADDSLGRTDAGVRVSVGAFDGGFYVEDDGPGIPPERRETVFEAGYSSAGGHAGIGLDIVRRIAGAHGWTVSLTDAESGGARFEFVVHPERPRQRDTANANPKPNDDG